MHEDILDRKMKLVYLLVLIISCSDNTLAGSVQGVGLNNTLTLGYTLDWDKIMAVGHKMGSGIILGIDEVYNRQLLPGYVYILLF